jgi:hypothetical protein
MENVNENLEHNAKESDETVGYGAAGGSEEAGRGDPDREKAKPSPCKGECKGYFYTTLNDEDLKDREKPKGMSHEDAREALKNALQRKHPCEQDDNAKCPDASCICQPLEVATSGLSAPNYTKPWKEEITAHIVWVNSAGVRHKRTVKGTVRMVKYYGSGICRPDDKEADAPDGTFYDEPED